MKCPRPFGIWLASSLLAVLVSGCCRDGAKPRDPVAPPPPSVQRCRFPPNPQHPDPTTWKSQSDELTALYVYAERLEITLAIARGLCAPLKSHVPPAPTATPR
jgi:hypothetical protein